MDRAERASEIRRAAIILRRAVKGLNRGHTKCGECGRQHFKDPLEAHVACTLQGVPQHLERMADTLHPPVDELDPDVCPTTRRENCPWCENESCNTCGPGNMRDCDHDVLDRHHGLKAGD